MDIKEFFDRQNWIFAKTYAAYAPHEYMVRARMNGTDDEFVKAVDYIQEHGIPMFYYKNKRQYLFLDGYFYWVIGDDISKMGVINRCKPEDYDIVFMRKGTNKK